MRKRVLRLYRYKAKRPDPGKLNERRTQMNDNMGFTPEIDAEDALKTIGLLTVIRIMLKIIF